MDSDKIKELVHIVASRASKDIENVKKSGENWFDYFTKNSLLKEGQRILDFGAGLGRVSIPFNRLADVVAVDGNPSMVEYLKENNIEAYLSNNCEFLIGEKFDFVISNFVLQHMHFPEAQLVVSQISKITNTFYFTYPIIEDGGCDSYMHYKDSYKVDLLESHDYSRKMHLNELPELFELSDFDTNTMKRLFSNLFVINKNHKLSYNK